MHNYPYTFYNIKDAAMQDIQVYREAFFKQRIKLFIIFEESFESVINF